MRIVELEGFGPAPVTALHFAPDGLTFAAVRRLDTWIVGLIWWDLRQNKAITTGAGDHDHGGGAEEDAGYAPDPALSADHRFLAYVYIERGPEYSLLLIDRAVPRKSRRHMRRLTALEWGEYQALHFSPDGRFLVAAVATFDEAAGGTPWGIYRWKVSSVLAGRGPRSDGGLLPEKEHLPIPRPDVWTHDSSRSLAFSPDGSVLVAGLWRGHVPRWEFPSGEALPPVSVKPRRTKVRRGHPPPGPPAWRLAFSADGRTLAVADETVTLFDAKTGAARAALPPGPPVQYTLGRPAGPYVHDLAYHPTEGLLATVCGDAILRWWDGATGAARAAFDCGVGPLTAVAFSPDGCVCATGSGEGRVALVDVDR